MALTRPPSPKPPPSPEGRAESAEQKLAQRQRRREASHRLRAARLRLVGETVMGAWFFVVRDLASLAGIALMSYGAWLAYAPAGYITGGVLLLAAAWISASKDN